MTDGPTYEAELVFAVYEREGDPPTPNHTGLVGAYFPLRDEFVVPFRDWATAEECGRIVGNGVKRAKEAT